MLSRIAWTDAPDDGAVIAQVSNELLTQCKGDYGWYLQANEVIHERSLTALRAYPARFPHVTLFRLPFLNLMGTDLAWRYHP